MITVIKSDIKQLFKSKTRKKKNSLVHIQKEMASLETENSGIIDKIAVTNSEFVQQ